jgi:outer membrane protein insertion porin family
MDGVGFIHGATGLYGPSQTDGDGSATEPKRCVLMKRLLTTVCVVLMLGVCAAHAQTDTSIAPRNLVSDVRVIGNNTLSDDAILFTVKTRAGQRYDSKVIQDDQRRLLETGKFESVVIKTTDTADGKIVTFDVVERPLIVSVEFKNNKAFPAEDLVKELPFRTGQPLSDYAIEANRKALVDFYQDEGFEFVEVTTVNAQGALTYTLVEGPNVVVNKITFEGNDHFNRLVLGQRIGTHRAVWPFVKGPLDIEQIERDVNLLRKLYVDDGYHGAQVSYRLEYNDDKSKVEVVFVIAQNPRYRINRVILKGSTAFTDQELLSRLPFGQGDFITADAIRLNARAVQDAYGEVGYINARVTPTTPYVHPDAEKPEWAANIPDDELAMVNLLITIDEEDQYHIGDIDIQGNDVTQERVIRRQLTFYPEHLYNAVAVERSRQHLMDTQLFSEVVIQPVGDRPGTRDVLVTVKEAKTAEFIVGVGYSTQQGVLGNISFTQRNFDITGLGRNRPGRPFEGGGQRFSIVLEPGTEMMRGHVEWFEPYLFDLPYSMGVKGYVFERERDDYDERRFGMVTSFGHRFKNRWYGEISNRVEVVDVRDVSNGAAKDIRDVKGTNLLIGMKGMLVRDNTDSRWMPTTGDRLEIGYEQVVGDFTFGKIETKYNWYKTLYTDAMDRKHFIGTKAQIGYIVGDAPVFERYYAGGLGSVRGFEYRGISPRGGRNGSRIGGDFMLLTGAEYNFPLYGNNLRGVMFVDSGTVETDVGLDNYRVAIGTGLRWTVPMMGPVPIHLNFAVPVVKASDDDTEVFSISLGFTF